ncbi:MAG: hypothetical protein AAGF13_08255 [Pseudomonadota bacterium]
MADKTNYREVRRRRRARRALRAARAHMADPQAKLPRVLAAYKELRARGSQRWVLPDA